MRHCTPLHIAALQSSVEAAEVIVRDSPKVVERSLGKSQKLRNSRKLSAAHLFLMAFFVLSGPCGVGVGLQHSIRILPLLPVRTEDSPGISIGPEPLAHCHFVRFARDGGAPAGRQGESQCALVKSRRSCTCFSHVSCHCSGKVGTADCFSYRCHPKSLKSLG